MMATESAPRGTLRVLFVEDSEDDAALIVRYLERIGYAVEHFRVDTRDGFETAVTNATWDLVISDHSMPQFSSIDALACVRARGLDYPFIIVSGTIGEETAVEAMRAGAHDYVLKNNLARLAPAIERELSDAELRRQAREERETRKAIERQLQQAQKMEAVGRLAGGIAHDFNNLLTAILGFTGIAIDRLATKGDVRFELDQVKQLLAFSRQQVLTPRRIDPVDAVESMAPMLRHLVGEHVTLETAGDVHGARVKVDPGQFEQVVMNLAINARDAMPSGGTLQITTSRVDLDVVEATKLQLPAGAYVALSVADSGTGMDEAVRARIFEPFFTTKPPGQGTGLGLSTVYGILQQSGGSIQVESIVNRGSTFTVYLPVAAAAAGADTPRPAPRQPRVVDGVQGTVLIAEDEESVRALVRTVLTTAGFQVLEAASGTDAARIVGQSDRPIDLLITDVIMPGMIGPDLARITVDRFPQARILYITGYAAHSAIPPGFLSEEDALLQKPFLPEQLLARVHERLGITT